MVQQQRDANFVVFKPIDLIVIRQPTTEVRAYQMCRHWVESNPQLTVPNALLLHRSFIINWCWYFTGTSNNILHCTDRGTNYVITPNVFDWCFSCISTDRQAEGEMKNDAESLQFPQLFRWNMIQINTIYNLLLDVMLCCFTVAPRTYHLHYTFVVLVILARDQNELLGYDYSLVWTLFPRVC